MTKVGGTQVGLMTSEKIVYVKHILKSDFGLSIQSF